MSKQRFLTLVVFTLLSMTTACCTLKGEENKPDKKFNKKEIPNLEKNIIEEIKTKGVGTRLVIKEFTPIDLGVSNAATIVTANDVVEITFEFPGDRCVVSAGGFTGFAVYSEEADVTNKVVLQKKYINIKDLLFSAEGWKERVGKTLGGENSIHRFYGSVDVNGYKFIGEGDKLDRLTFALIEDVGYVYLRGKGRVFLKDGKVVKLGKVFRNEDRELIDAAKKGVLVRVKQLIEQGADVNAWDNEGVTSLMWALQKGYVDIAKFLIQKGADVNEKSTYGVTALMVAATKGYTEVTKLLIEKRADVNAREDKLGITSLIRACEMNHTEVAKLLIENGADVNTKDNEGVTALLHVANQGNTKIARLLLEKGADANAQDKYKVTPLMFAIGGGHTEMIKLLVEKGADVNKTGEGVKMTPLIGAISLGHTEIVRLLIKNGANVNLKDKSGNTPLKIAQEKGYNEIINILKQAGAKE